MVSLQKISTKSLTAFGSRSGEPIAQAAVAWFMIAKQLLISTGEIDVIVNWGRELLSEFTCTSRSKLNALSLLLH